MLCNLSGNIMNCFDLIWSKIIFAIKAKTVQMRSKVHKRSSATCRYREASSIFSIPTLPTCYPKLIRTKACCLSWWRVCFLSCYWLADQSTQSLRTDAGFAQHSTKVLSLQSHSIYEFLLPPSSSLDYRARQRLIFMNTLPTILFFKLMYLVHNQGPVS